MSLLCKETIAAAVAREIRRIDQAEQSGQTGANMGEGTAYKAAWDRRGSSALKHCADSHSDALLCDLLVRCTLPGGARDYASFEARRGGFNRAVIEAARATPRPSQPFSSRFSI